MAMRRASSVEAVLAAAGTVFRRKGYQRATIDDIATAAGVSKPTVYKYAKSKAWLLEQISQTVIDDMQADADRVAAMDAPVLERLDALIRSHIAMSIKHRVFYGILWSEETELSSAGRKRMRAWSHERTRDLERLLTDCQTEGLLRSGVDITVAANLVTSAMNSLYRWYRPKGPVAPDELARQVMGLLAGLLSMDAVGPRAAAVG
jgi:AcrR family transcriptional regulator